MMNESYPFSLKPLKYEYDALEPYIDEKTVRIHHDKHLKKYVDELNNIIEDYPVYYKVTLFNMLRNLKMFPEEIRTKVKNNAGGVFNHNMYFDVIGKNVQNSPTGKVREEIIKKYGSIDRFYEEFKKAAMQVFGSGYAFLVINKQNELEIITTKDQNTPLELDLYPILLIDVWEHAYYLKYQNLRNEYVDNFMKIINWNKVEDYYNNFFMK